MSTHLIVNSKLSHAACVTKNINGSGIMQLHGVCVHWIEKTWQFKTFPCCTCYNKQKWYNATMWCMCTRWIELAVFVDFTLQHFRWPYLIVYKILPCLLVGLYVYTHTHTMQFWFIAILVMHTVWILIKCVGTSYSFPSPLPSLYAPVIKYIPYFLEISPQQGNF